MQNSLHVYIVNLQRATERWKNVSARVDPLGFAYTRIEAVDGRLIALPIPEFDQTGHRLLTGRRPIPPEIGCYLSHIRAVDAFLASEHTHALILEDDAEFRPDAAHAITSALGFADRWDICRLSSVNSDRVAPVRALANGYSIGVNLTRSKGAAGYIVNRRAAKSIRQWLMPMRMAWDIAFDLEYLVGLRAMAVTPYPIREDGLTGTQIQFSIGDYKYPKTRYFSVLPFRIVTELLRVLLRPLVALAALIRPRGSMPEP